MTYTLCHVPMVHSKNRGKTSIFETAMCRLVFLTYILGRKSEVSFFCREHVCKSLSETVNTSDHSKWPHSDLKIKVEKRPAVLG